MATYKQLSDAGDGTILGQSASDNIAFYGGTPTTQRTSSAQATITVTIRANTTGFVFSSTVGANKLINQVAEIRATLTALKLWKGS